MSARQLLHLVALIAVAGINPTPASAAVTCGTSNPKTHATAKATLDLDPDSVTTIAFKRDTDPQKMLIRFKATGCVLPNDAPDPTVDILPRQDIKNVPDSVLSLSSAIRMAPTIHLPFLLIRTSSALVPMEDSSRYGLRSSSPPARRSL